MRLPLSLMTATPVATGSSRSAADQRTGSAPTLIGIACPALLAASVFTSIVAVKMHLKQKLIERDEDRILAALEELNSQLAQLAHHTHPDSANVNPWPAEPLSRPPRHWEDEV